MSPVPIAYLVKINKYNNIENINPISVCFDRKLSLGTILYGIYFNIDDIKHFCCLDITFYKGEEVSNKLFSDKLILFHSLFKNYIGQYSILSVPIAVILGIPIYAGCSAVVPLIFSITANGVPLGTSLAFMMSIAGLSLPEGITKSSV